MLKHTGTSERGLYRLFSDEKEDQRIDEDKSVKYDDSNLETRGLLYAKRLRVVVRFSCRPFNVLYELTKQTMMRSLKTWLFGTKNISFTTKLERTE